MLIKIILMLVFMTQSIDLIPINNSSIFNNELHRPSHRSSFKSLHRSLAKRALSYIANETVCIIDNLIYQNGDPIPTDDPCESCKCKPPSFACVLKECDVKPGCKEVIVEGECCPTYQCGCEHDNKFYKDGEIVPNPNKLLNCYSCKCRGSSIICGLMDCLLRYDCEPIYRAGECCPNYDHCDIPSTSTQNTISENQTIYQTSTNKVDKSLMDSTEKPTSPKAISKMTELLSSDQTIAITNKSTTESLINENSTPKSFLIINEKPTVTISDTNSVSTQSSNKSTFTTISPLLSSSTQETTSNKVFSEKISENEFNNDTNDISKDNENDELNRVNSQSSGLVIGNNSLDRNDEKLSNQNSTFNDDEIISNFNSSQSKITQSTVSSYEVTPLISNQVDQIDKRIDFEINIKLVDSKGNESTNDEINDKIEIKTNNENLNEDKNKNEISDEILVQPTMKADPIETNSLNQVTTLQSLIDINIPSSTTTPNITDTTILAPNTNPILNFTTQSSIIKDDESISRNNLDELSKNDTSPINTDDLSLSQELKESKIKSQEEENEVKKMEEKLERTSIELDNVTDNKIDELRTPIDMLKKVLDNCANGKCNSMDKLLKITEETLKEFDTLTIEKVKLSEAFDQLRIKLIGNSNTTLSTLSIQTDIPIEINSTDSGIIEIDEDSYPTTIKYVRTSDLIAEHRNI